MQYKSKKQTPQQKEKAKFRQTAAWKSFRQQLKKDRKVDFVTGKPLRAGFQVHHCDLNPEHYKNLDPDNYILFNRTFHKVVHEIYRYNWQDVLERLAIVFRKMDELNPPPSDPQQKLFN